MTKGGVLVDLADNQDGSESLQSAFKQFRIKKIKEHKAREACKKNVGPRDHAALRQEVVERAMKYLNVPYSKKYFQEGTPEFEAEIFLDCCGLVRQVIREMAESLGFHIGRWNQGYQYDTLRNSLITKDELKPGDLIFTRATYIREGAKEQPHDMVHVEIYLGDGKTLGSRSTDPLKECRVLVHEDMSEFESTSYHEQVYEYCSITPWLDGDCEVHCDEHREAFAQSDLHIDANKKSIFADELAE